MRKEIDKVKFTQVRHMPDSSKYKPKGYASWMGFWKDKMAASTRLPINDISYCYCCKKNKTVFVGGHVISKDEEKYICPICKECNDMAKEKMNIQNAILAFLLNYWSNSIPSTTQILWKIRKNDFRYIAFFNRDIC